MAYNKLGSSQKAFIEAKVKELGNLEAVNAHYNKKALVDRYAISIAKKVYKNEK